MDSKDSQPQSEKKITHLKEKKTRMGRKRLVSESKTEVVMEVPQKAYKGEKIGTTIRKDHKFDAAQRLPLNRSGRSL